MKKIAILALAIFVTAPVFAAIPVQFIATEDVTYDDNIYLKDKDYGDKKGSLISTTRVGANYKAQLPNTGLNLTTGALVGYNAYTEKASKNNYWDARGVAEVANQWMKVGDNLLFTSDPANSSLTDRYKRLNNDAYASFKTTNEKLFSVGVSVQDIFDRYYESEMSYLNRNRVNAGAQIYYNFNTQTNLFVEYMFSDIVYKTNQDNNSTGHSIGLGVNGQIAPKVTGTAKVTYNMRNYSHDKAGADNNSDLFGYYLALTWNATERDVIRLSGERRMEETLYGANRYFADTLVALYGQHKFNSKWAAALTLAWEDLAYEKSVADTKRKDNLYTIRPQVDYAFKEWLMASAWYQFRTRHSNTKWAEYDSNKVGVSVKALF